MPVERHCGSLDRPGRTALGTKLMNDKAGVPDIGRGPGESEAGFGAVTTGNRGPGPGVPGHSVVVARRARATGRGVLPSDRHGGSATGMGPGRRRRCTAPKGTSVGLGG